LNNEQLIVALEVKQNKSGNAEMKQSIYIYLVLPLLMLAALPVRAEVIFFDDSVSQAIVAPTSSRWTPGHDDGICVSSVLNSGGLCGAGSFTEEAVWGALLAPSFGVTLDTNLAHYSALGLTPLPFNDFLWITEPGNPPFNLYSDYLYNNANFYTGAIYLQFNSAFEAGFHCTDFLQPTDCGQPHTIAEQEGVVTAGYVLWSDGSSDQITFRSIGVEINNTGVVPEPSSLFLLVAGLVLLSWRCRKARPQLA